MVQDPASDKKSGVIQVTLVDPTNSTYSVHKVHKSETMRVIKDTSSLPVISITGGGRFEEGQDGVFYLQADRAPSSAIQVTVALTDPQLFLVSSSNRTVEISSTVPVPLYLPTDGDSNQDMDNTITATIQADPAMTDTYEVSSANNSATITVYDNDDLNLPSVQISGSGSTTEGRTVGFTITVSPMPSQPLDVDIDILREGDFFPDEIESKLTKKTVTVPTTGTFIYSEPTVADAIDEPHGKITVTIRTSTTNPTSYSVRSQFRVSTTIHDNDHADTPAVSIVAGGDIIEGENAFFTISTNAPIATALPVGISIAYQGEFFSQTGVQTPTITLPISSAGQREKATSSYIYHIPTLYDMEDEEDGHVIISIQNDINPTPRYSIGANSIATVIVKDDDEPNPASGIEQRPVISIFSNLTETGVTMNYPLNVTVVSSKRLETEMLVLIKGERTNPYTPYFRGFKATVNRYIRIPRGASRASATFHFENCPTCSNSQPAESYIFTIQNPSNLYLVNEQFKSVEINVKNNDQRHVTLPVISIAPVSENSIFEGETARFIITSDRAITEELKINYWVSIYPLYTSDNLFELRSVTFPADSSPPHTHILEFPTKIRDEILNTTISIQLRDGKGYVRSPVGNNINASIAINDVTTHNSPSLPNLTDKKEALSKPVVAVNALTSTVSELEVAGFEISVRSPITSTIENGRIVNRVDKSRPVLVRFKLVESGSAIPNYLKRPSRADFSSDTDFNDRLSRFEEGFNEIAESFYGCQIHPNLEFSCWINKRRNFSIRTFDGSGERAISLFILGSSVRYFSDYFVDRSKAAATLFIRDETLPVITINPTQIDINTIPGSFSYAEFQLRSNGNTDNISTKIMLQVDDPRGIITSINSSTDLLEHTTDNLFKPGRPYELIFSPRNDGRLLLDFYSIQSVLSADAFITVRILPAQSSDKYVVGSPSAATLFTNAQSTSANGVSIFATSESAKSGEPVFFNIKSKNDFSSPTTVNISLDQGDGNIIAGDEGLTRQLTFRANTKSQYLKVDTHELAPNSKTESITATLQSGTGYTIVQAHNSAKTTLTSFQQHLIASVKNVTGSNGGTLETENGVTETAATSIVEGEIAYFEFTLSLPRKNLTLSNRNKITSYQMPKEGIVLDFEVQDTNNFIFSDSSNNIDYAYSIHFPYREFLPNNVFESGSDTDPIVFTKVIFPLQTQVVAGYNFGPLTITIGNDPTGGRLYQIAASPDNTASININDNFLSSPEISIQKGTDPITGQSVDTITEGEQLRAVISLSSQALYGFYVQLKATEIGNFLNVGQDGKTFNVEIGVGTNQRDFIPVIFDDDVEEENGEVRFTVMAGAGYTVNSNQNKVDFDIMDNDGAPIIGFGVTDSIGEGVGNAEIAVTLSNPTEMAVNFKYITMTGTATAAEDYTEIVAASPATGIFEKGHTTIMIPVAITDDTVSEGNENFRVRITEVTNGNFAGSATFIEQTITIADDDDSPFITFGDPVSANEDAGFAEIEVLVSEMSEKVVGFSYITENSSAITPADFTGISATSPASGTIAIGETKTTIRIPIIDDNSTEYNENFTIKITSLTNARFHDNKTSVETMITIIDNDSVSFTIADSSIVEGNSGTTEMEFSVILSAEADRPVSVTWGTYIFDLQNTATPNVDFMRVTNKILEFLPGEITKKIAVDIIGDTEKESHENFTVGLTNPSTGASIAISSATGRIISDDAPNLEIVAGSSVTEADDVVATFTISTNDESPNDTITVYYNLTESGNFIDIEGNNKTINLDFTNGSTDDTLSIPIINDTESESEGTITVTLIPDKADPISYFVAVNSEARVRVTDDDAPTTGILPTINIAADSGIVAENDGPAKFILTATDLETPGLVIRATPAEDGHDFLTNAVADTPNDFPVKFFDRGNGIFSGELSVFLDDDNDGETTGQIKLTINEQIGVQSYQLGTGTEGVITILDDDAPELKITGGTPVTEAEGAVATFTITAEVIPAESITIYYTVSENSPNDGDGDFLNESEEGDKNQLLVFRSNNDSVDITIPLENDMTPEDNATISIELTTDQSTDLVADRSYMVSASQNTASVQVIDDDNENPQIIVTAGTSVEEGSPATFIFSANSSVDLPVDIEFNVNLEGNFTLWRIPQSFTLTTERSGILMIATHDDEIHEPEGSITVSIVATQDYGILDGLDADTVTISDNDLAPDDPNRLPPEPRVSVASTAVNAIIGFLGTDTPESAQLNESASILPLVSIQASIPIVSEGSLAEFILISNRRPETFEISVKLHVNPVGEFFEFEVPRQISVQIQSSTPVPVNFQTIDDSIAEDDGRLEISIITDSSYEIVANQNSTSVIISDAIDRNARQDLLSASAEAFLPDVVGNMVARTSEIISQRIQQGFSETSEVALNLGGEETIKGIIERSGQMTNESSFAWQEVLGDSSVAFTLLSGEDFNAPATIWGVGDHRDLSSNSSENILNWSGKAFTGQIGIDTLIGEEIITGISASFSENDIEIDEATDTELEFSLNSTSIYPYIGWTSPNHDTEVRAVTGYGVGKLTVDQSDYSREALVSKSYSLALAGRKELFSSDMILNGVTKLSVIGDSWFARQYVKGQENLISDVETNAHYYNVRTEGTHQFELESGNSLTPFLSVGVRGDRKSQHSTLAMEFTSGLDFVSLVGIYFTSSGQMLVAKENAIQKMSANSTLGYDYGNDELGLTLEISPSWGQSQVKSQNSLWSNNILVSENEIGQYTNGTQVKSKIGYGFSLGENSRKLTFYSGYLYDDQIEDELLLGSSVHIGSNFGIDLEGIKEIRTAGEEATKLKINGRLSW